MFCIYCGARLPEKAAFCPACGAKVTWEISGGKGAAGKDRCSHGLRFLRKQSSQKSPKRRIYL